jgi:beta-mannosidase
VTSGPYMPIILEIYKSRIENIHVNSDIRDDFSSAEIDITIELVNDAAKSFEVVVEDDGGNLVKRQTLNVEGSGASTRFQIDSPSLWWPNGEGSQPLYKVEVKAYDLTGSLLHMRSSRFGIRRIRLIQRPLTSAEGKTFLFNVNGRDIFIQGGNWIPANNLLPTISRQRYFDWIKLAKYSHLNMIRVWGGGIYETEDFFDACDEMGLLVWHDYAFACGDYPIHDEFLTSIMAEAEYQTKRMRSRASLALLCGCNEDFMLADWEKYARYLLSR